MKTRMAPFFALALFNALTCNRYSKAQPNIILIMSDDTGYSHIGCSGGEIRTPTLDELAANGLRYTQFYNTARCCPTRAYLLTGNEYIAPDDNFYYANAISDTAVKYIEQHKPDRTELHDIAAQYPERIAEMVALWQSWAERVGAVPMPPR